MKIMDNTEKKYPASENSWYAAATIYGVPESWRDTHRRVQNKIIWNRYVSRFLSQKQKQDLIKSGFAKSDELTPINDTELLGLWSRRISENPYLQGRIFPGIEGGPVSGAHTIGKIDWNGIDFDHDVYFEGYLFPASVELENARFNGEANFSRAVFFEDVFLRRTTFEDVADFTSAKFYNSLTINFSKFSNLTIFYAIESHKYASFHSCCFSDETDFSDSVLLDGADFSNCEFKDIVNFSTSVFSNGCSFINTYFRSTTNFSSCRFQFPPAFQGSKMHPDTIWPKRDDKESWPKAPETEVEAGSAERAWASLKWSMNQVQSHDAELDFFARELEARRVNLKWPKTWVVDLYRIFSNYGRSALRPFSWWIGLYLLAATINFVAIGGSQEGISLQNIIAVGSFTLENAFPFGRSTDVAQSLSSVPRWLDFVSAGHTFLSLLFIFLIGLALRNRLRIK